MMDLMPTLLEAADARYPDAWKGRALVPLQGRSMLPLLRGEAGETYANRELGLEAYGMDAYRRGDWKVLRLPEPFGNGSWQLYDLASDPGERDDLAPSRPELVEDLGKAWEEYAAANGVIRPDSPIAYGKPITGRKF